MKSLMYFFTNVNLVLPVVAAVAVIVSAIVFICVFRVRHAQMLKPPGKNSCFILFPYSEKIGGAFGAGGEDSTGTGNPHFPGLPQWLDLNIVVPTIATVIVICVGIIIVCAVCVITKRNPPQMTPGLLSTPFLEHFLIKIGYSNKPSLS
jgi:heme/copper-type cytochrome/quinol oxidase subunit 2